MTLDTDEIFKTVTTVKEMILTRLHDRAGLCRHCGKKKCDGKKGNSILPLKIKTDDVLWAINGSMPSEDSK